MEIYISSCTGMSQLLVDGRKVRPDFSWDQNKISDFIWEVAWSSKVRLDPHKPFSGSTLLNLPWRWHAVTTPMSPEGPFVVLRRQRFNHINLSHFYFDNFEVDDCRSLILDGSSIILFGATGSGKTSLMVALMQTFFAELRVGIAESHAEIPLLYPDWFRLVEVPPDIGGRGGVDFTRVLAELMRLSPQRLVIGELRGREAAMLSEFARTGHGGVLSTIHAGSFENCRMRLESLTGQTINSMAPLVGVYVRQNQNGEYLASMEHLN